MSSRNHVLPPWRELDDYLQRITRLLNRLRAAVTIQWTVFVPGLGVGASFANGGSMLLMTNVQKVELTIQPLDQYGNPAKIDGAATWNLSDSALGTITPDPADSLKASFAAGEPTGTVQVSVQVDADQGEGVTTISGTLDIQIEPSEAVSVGIVAGVPEAK